MSVSKVTQQVIPSSDKDYRKRGFHGVLLHSHTITSSLYAPPQRLYFNQPFLIPILHVCVVIAELLMMKLIVSSLVLTLLLMRLGPLWWQLLFPLQPPSTSSLPMLTVGHLRFLGVFLSLSLFIMWQCVFIAADLVTAPVAPIWWMAQMLSILPMLI
jgi:hypothetical protein